MQKKLVLDTILAEIKKGLNPSQIAQKYNSPKTTVAYYVKKLKGMGCIEKDGYGLWSYKKQVRKQVRIRPIGSHHSQTRTSPQETKGIRGHAFIWKIRFGQEIHWKKKLRAVRVPFQTIGNGKVYRIIFNNRKIWLTKKGMVIYEPIDFMGKSSFEVKGMAVFEMDQLVKKLLKKLKIKFRSYKFTTSREHYGMVRNELAKQYNDRGDKMHIQGEDGTTWLWIDDSHSLGELETAKPVISRQVQNFWNDNKKHNFEVTPSFVLGTFNQIAQNDLSYRENIKSHIKAIQDLGDGIGKLTDLVGKLGKNEKEI